ncbi:ABC transporter ATP-binding protein [Cryptosporangium aurantiacum]|uniref:Putative ABC transport system ATP-binding protein n=1 Tax=Cryptosporangium aurantiacum TaxID=134849 RepID=A0A1M7RK29_9ACTN|nr:ABC transporter ATP-binding protein [Cryptosporangium aurantiacum]SHN46522.1 putative ABC transport system ATP-binding protein [Cryptosporangium aurantiacum]
MTFALVVRGVRKTFDQDSAAPVPALRGADLTVEPGEFVAVTGPSGCGKSTLINVVAGLERPDDGTVEVGGVRVDTLGADAAARFRRRHVGLVFQFFELLDDVSAADNVRLAALLGGVGRRRAGQRTLDVLDLLGLLDKADAAPHALSGGQRQRLAIARALANEPPLLLADEPTGALDSAGAAEVLELLQRLNASGQTIVVVTHDAAVASAAARVVRMRDGCVVTEDVPA